MRSGTRTLHFATPPPASTQRYHLSPKAGDSRAAIRRTSQQPAGGDHVKCLDYNLQLIVLKEPGAPANLLPIGAHWPKIGQNGYDRVRDPRGNVRMLTAAEKRMTIQAWVNKHGGNRAALKLLRRKNGDQFLIWAEAVAYARTRGVVLTPELKSRGFNRADVAEYMVAVCRKLDYPLWAMALLKMKDAEGKAKAIINAGGHFSLIFGKFTSQARGTNKIANWSVKPSQIWGPASARRWIR